MLICVRLHFMNFQRQTYALPSLLQCFTSLNALISAGKKCTLLNQPLIISTSPRRSWIECYIFNTIFFWTLQFGKIILICLHELSASFQTGHNDLVDSISRLCREICISFTGLNDSAFIYSSWCDVTFSELLFVHDTLDLRSALNLFLQNFQPFLILYLPVFFSFHLKAVF